ncbi:MAG: hypothetical protein RLZZ326_3922 [Planctomycetota bacterium]
MRDERRAVGSVRLGAGRSGLGTARPENSSSFWGVRATAMIAMVLATAGITLRSAEAQNLDVNSGTTTISSGTGVANTSVATGASDTATLIVTTSGSLAGTGTLIVGNNGKGVLNVTGGSVSNTDGTLGFASGFNPGSGTATVSSGTWANSGVLTVGRLGRGLLTVTGGYVSSGSAILGSQSASGIGGLTVRGSGTAAVSGGTWANSGDLVVGGAGTGVLTMTGGLVSVSGSLSRGSLGTIHLNSGGTLQIGSGNTSGVLLGGTGALTNNGTLIFNRSDASTYSGVLSGSGAVVKQGAGQLTLSGTNTYTGGTTLTAGTLALGSLANSAVTVGNGGTLGGSGSLGALLTVHSGGVLSPGNSPGALAAAALDLQEGSTTFMQVIGSGAAAGAAGTNYDQVQIASSGTLRHPPAPSGTLRHGGSLDLDFGNLTKFLNGTVFDLFACTVSPVGHFSSVFSTGTGLYANASFSGTGGIWTSTIGDQLLSFSELTGRLSFTSSGGGAVPEIDPATGSSALALVAGVLAMIEQRRRRAKASSAWRQSGRGHANNPGDFRRLRAPTKNYASGAPFGASGGSSRNACTSTPAWRRIARSVPSGMSPGWFGIVV